MEFLVDETKKSGASVLRDRYVPSAKNGPIAEFLPACGFRKCPERDEFVLDLSTGTPGPPLIPMEAR